MTDSEYGDALDLGIELGQTLADVTAIIDHLRHIERRAAEPRSESRYGPGPPIYRR